MKVELREGDNRIHLQQMIERGEFVDSVVTDPPYGLTSIAKRFGKAGAAAARGEGNDGSFGRLSGGFMGVRWDATGIERDPEFWKLVYGVLKPGGCVFAFSGSRTGHWQACAMELAGFIMHPMHGWAFGQGFPKGHAADKAIDKSLGKKGTKGAVRGASGSQRNSMSGDFEGGEYHDYIPATEEAAEWSGYAYGTQTQKPALEPIYLGQKPFSERTGAKNLLKHGVGAFNIDACRVPAAGSDGRYPTNLLLDGSDEVVGLFPDSKGQLVNESVRAGRVKTAAVYGEMRGRDGEASAFRRYGELGSTNSSALPGERRNDAGSASRFFHQFPLTDEDYELAKLAGIISEVTADAIIYNPKAGKIDRGGSKHPTVKPIALIRYLVRHVTPPGGTVLDMFAGTGTTAVAADHEKLNCILMEQEPEYIRFIRSRFDLSTHDPFDLSDILGSELQFSSGLLV